MGTLNYQIWSRINRGGIDADDLLRDLKASGTLTTSSSLSSTVTLPTVAGDLELVGVFRVFGDAVYVPIRAPGQSVPAGTGAHAASDAQPRMLISPDDGAVAVLLPSGGSFAVVNAASL